MVLKELRAKAAKRTKMAAVLNEDCKTCCAVNQTLNFTHLTDRHL